MDLGLAILLTDYWMQPGGARRAWVEERGFESLFLPEHTHIPVSRETPYPGGGELPREYSHTLDPSSRLRPRRPRRSGSRSAPESAS